MKYWTDRIDMLSITRLRKNRTFLPVDIWVNGSGLLRKEFSDNAVILFQKGENLPATPENLIPMSITDETEIWAGVYDVALPSDQVLKIKLFVRGNRENLLRLSDSEDEYDVFDFVNDMKTLGFHAEVNRTVFKSSLGNVEVVGPNSDGEVVLPKDWYDPEDDIYDELFGCTVSDIDLGVFKMKIHTKNSIGSSYERIMEYSHNVLQNNPEADCVRRFLDHINISEEIVNRFQLGFIPETVNHEFSDRLIFPVRDINGKCIALIGKKMHRDNSAKYLIRENDKFLYGLFEAAESIKETGTVILCEWPLEVLTLHCNSVPNCCVLLSSITDSHIEALKSLSCRKVVCCFDNNDYGKRKTIETTNALRKNGFDIIDVPVSRICESVWFLSDNLRSWENNHT